MRFTYEDHTFEREIIRDEDMGPPWKEHDGHGVIIKSREKPCDDHHYVVLSGGWLWYDKTASMEKAADEGWGLSHGEVVVLTKRLGHEPTKIEILTDAVRRDYEWLKDWVDGAWWWVGVKVTLLKADEDAIDGYYHTRFNASVWGIESTAGDDYFAEVANEIAADILSEYQRAREAKPHPHVGVGHCKVCGHYGRDCTGK